VLSVTTGNMLQRPAAYKLLWSGLMSDPGYGDLSVNANHDLKGVEWYVLCRPRNPKYPKQDPRK